MVNGDPASSSALSLKILVPNWGKQVARGYIRGLWVLYLAMNTLSPDDSKNGTQLNNNKWFRENVDLSGDNNTNILVVYVHKLGLRLF